jgi:hypothetical protein
MRFYAFFTCRAWQPAVVDRQRRGKERERKRERERERKGKEKKAAVPATRATCVQSAQ